jgi:hypothetical protein
LEQFIVTNLLSLSLSAMRLAVRSLTASGVATPTPLGNLFVISYPKNVLNLFQYTPWSSFVHKLMMAI